MAQSYGVSVLAEQLLCSTYCHKCTRKHVATIYQLGQPLGRLKLSQMQWCKEKHALGKVSSMLSSKEMGRAEGGWWQMWHRADQAQKGAGMLCWHVPYPVPRPGLRIQGSFGSPGRKRAYIPLFWRDLQQFKFPCKMQHYLCWSCCIAAHWTAHLSVLIVAT